MNKDDRSGLNPFTGKSHLDLVNDDKFLEQVYVEYNKILNNSQLMDGSEAGELVKTVSDKLISAVESYLKSINRYDYVENYYDWEFHLIQERSVNAFCMPGGKIVVFSGLFGVVSSEEELAFIIGHEMAHALLDHGRTKASVNMAKAGLTTAARLGSLALILTGNYEEGNLLGATTDIADVGSHYLLVQPFGRGHELEADRLGMMLIYWAGYNIEDIPGFWDNMAEGNPNNFDFFSTHPSDSKRIENMRKLINEIKNEENNYTIPELNTEGFIRCESCGELIENDSQFCPFCGVQLYGKMKCESCGELIDNNSKFCTSCGVPVNYELKCMNCGANINEKDNFCEICGYKLK